MIKMEKENIRTKGLAGYRDMSTSLGEEQISREPEQNARPITYRVRDKKRPVVGVLVTALAVGAAIAYTIGYIHWATEGSREYERSIRQSQIEEVFDGKELNENGGLRK